MAYTKFIPEVWSQQIETDLRKALVIAEDCNTNYEGEIKKMGDTVHILSADRPTITHFNNTAVTLSAPQTVNDNETILAINQVDTFNFKVGDLDAAQAVPGVMSTLTSEATYGLAEAIDSHIASGVVQDASAIMADGTAQTITAANILQYIDTNLQKLYEHNVPRTGNIVLDVTPWFYMLLKQAYTALDTDNSKILENGYVGKYGNVKVKMSNNIHTSSGTSMIMLRTDKAVAFAKQKTHIEPYRVELDFADALKGFVLYGYKLARPSEMIVLNCHA